MKIKAIAAARSQHGREGPDEAAQRRRLSTRGALSDLPCQIDAALLDYAIVDDVTRRERQIDRSDRRGLRHRPQQTSVLRMAPAHQRHEAFALDARSGSQAEALNAGAQPHTGCLTTAA